MMTILNETFLLRYHNIKNAKTISQIKQTTHLLSGTKKAFLSHSHIDKKIAEGLVAFFMTQEIELYIDWMDSSMPEKTNRETADKIKQQIQSSDFVFVLATSNALKSRWVPWEIGIADTNKSTGKIVIMPIANEYGHFEGSEYLQLYPHVEISEQDVPFLFYPHMDHGIPFEKWVKVMSI